MSYAGKLTARPAFGLELLRLTEKSYASLQSGDYLTFTQIFVICIPIHLEMFNNHASGQERVGGLEASSAPQT